MHLLNLLSYWAVCLLPVFVPFILVSVQFIVFVPYPVSFSFFCIFPSLYTLLVTISVLHIHKLFIASLLPLFSHSALSSPPPTVFAFKTPSPTNHLPVLSPYFRCFPSFPFRFLLSSFLIIPSCILLFSSLLHHTTSPSVSHSNLVAVLCPYFLVSSLSSFLALIIRSSIPLIHPSFPYYLFHNVLLHLPPSLLA